VHIDVLRLGVWGRGQITAFVEIHLRDACAKLERMVSTTGIVLVDGRQGFRRARHI
jgi:hypothetical protein